MVHRAKRGPGVIAAERTRLRHEIDRGVRLRLGVPIPPPEEVALGERVFRHVEATGGATLRDVQSALSVSERSSYRACAALLASGRVTRRRVSHKVVYEARP